MPLRDYQSALKHKVYDAWGGGAQNVVMRLGTGGGKTVILSDIVQEHTGASAVIAHRHEITSQLSLALARNGVRHNIIASKETVRGIVQAHMAELGRSFYDPGARCAVISVDTFGNREGLASWASQVTLWISDEGHHVVHENKWDAPRHYGRTARA
jgi:superfamily II DNA or RNA helicase